MNQIFIIEKVTLYSDGVTMSDCLDRTHRFTLIIIFSGYKINRDLFREEFAFMEPAITASHIYNSANVSNGRFTIYLAPSL